MSIHTRGFVTVLVLIATVANPIKGSDSRKLDETPPGDVKCTPCEQNSPPPPPSPPPPCPPPPSPPVLPPPSPKKPPSTKYCPPPPPASYIYITGPPGSLYPVDQDFGGAGRSSAVKLPILVLSGLLGLFAFW